jgi:sugar-specific transcriptional regulator TrmB
LNIHKNEVYLAFKSSSKVSQSGDFLEFSAKIPPSYIKTHDSKADAWRYVRANKQINVQLNILRKALSGYGLSGNEIEAYVYLARAGEKKASEISETMSFHRTETYKVLRYLEKKGLVLSIFGKPVKFVAVRPDKAVELLLEAQKMRVRLFEKERVDFNAIWSSMPKVSIDYVEKREVMQALEGRWPIILKANELLDKAVKEVQIFAPDRYLTLLHRSDFMESLEKHSYSLDIDLVTENSLKSRIFCEQTGWASHKYYAGPVNKLPCFMISDERELLAIYRKDVEGRDNRGRKSTVAGLWTNCCALVESMRVLFSELLGRRENLESSGELSSGLSSDTLDEE